MKEKNKENRDTFPHMLTFFPFILIYCFYDFIPTHIRIQGRKKHKTIVSYSQIKWFWIKIITIMMMIAVVKCKRHLSIIVGLSSLHLKHKIDLGLKLHCFYHGFKYIPVCHAFNDKGKEYKIISLEAMILWMKGFNSFFFPLFWLVLLGLQYFERKLLWLHLQNTQRSPFKQRHNVYPNHKKAGK